jgi:hypothetical protein
VLSSSRTPGYNSVSNERGREEAIVIDAGSEPRHTTQKPLTQSVPGLPRSPAIMCATWVNLVAKTDHRPPLIETARLHSTRPRKLLCCPPRNFVLLWLPRKTEDVGLVSKGPTGQLKAQLLLSLIYRCRRSCRQIYLLNQWKIAVVRLLVVQALPVRHENSTDPLKTLFKVNLEGVASALSHPVSRLLDGQKSRSMIMRTTYNIGA